MGKLSFGHVSKRAPLEDISSENKMFHAAICELGLGSWMPPFEILET